MTRKKINQIESSEKAQSSKKADTSQQVDLVTDLALDALGIVLPIPVASIASLIKTGVKIHRKEDFTSEDAGVVLLNVLGFIPGVSTMVSIISAIGHLSQLRKSSKSI